MSRAPPIIALLALFGGIASAAALAQSAPAPESPPPSVTENAPPPAYKPPLRGAPGGRVGGASRGILRLAAPLPNIDLLAPADHAGVTVTPTPTLLFYTSRPAAWPTQLAVSARLQSTPVVETTIPSPRQAGLQVIRLADYGVRLQPGVLYTWSIAIVVDQRDWSHNVVASASVLYDPTVNAGAALSAPPLRRAALLADAGAWYDAVAAAVEAYSLDHGSALNALMHQVGLDNLAGR